MSDSLIYRTDRPWPNRRFKIGAIVGHTTSSSCRLWLRTGRPGRFQLLLYRKSSDTNGRLFSSFQSVPYSLTKLPKHVRRHPFVVRDYSNDTTHVVDLANLDPDTYYAYALWGKDVGGAQPIPRVLLGRDQPRCFRTLAADDRAFSFAFFSCHMPYKKTLFGRTRIVNMETWEAFQHALSRHGKQDLRFVLATGDQVYADGVSTLSIWELLKKKMRKSGSTLLPRQSDMVTWYRDIYRGYWGFEPIQQIYSSFPTYMIWDDHEIGDGWGSFKTSEINRMIPVKRGWSSRDRRALAQRMFRAARYVYNEYEHSHNPATPAGQFDYAFRYGGCAFYVLDGRGYRDMNRRSYRILGQRQFQRFTVWLRRLDPASTKFVFVISAVPLLHLSAVAGKFGSLAKSLQDDLRDSWDHKIHDAERKEFTDALFATARRGIHVSVLSGDVHTAAVFRIKDKATDNVIYQLTSSAITYNVPRISGWLMAAAAAGRGKTRDGHAFERVALYRDSNFAMIHVDSAKGRAEFRLYGKGQGAEADEQDWRIPAHTSSRATEKEREWTQPPGAHSIATIPLDFP